MSSNLELILQLQLSDNLYYPPWWLAWATLQIPQEGEFRYMRRNTHFSIYSIYSIYSLWVTVRRTQYIHKAFWKKKKKSDNLYTNELKLKLVFSLVPKSLFHSYQNVFIKMEAGTNNTPFHLLNAYYWGGVFTLLLLSYYWGITTSKYPKAHQDHRYHLLKLVKHTSLQKDASTKGTMQNHCYLSMPRPSYAAALQMYESQK